MRIAIFAETYYPFVSGVVTHIETLKDGLKAAGHEVLIVTLNPSVKKHVIKDDVLYCPAIPLKKIYNYGVANPFNLERFKMVKEFKPDLVHLHTEFTMGLFAMYVAKQLRIPAVYTLHTMYDEYIYYLLPQNKSMETVAENLAQPFAHSYIRNICKAASGIIGPSQKVAKYIELCGVKKHVNVVPNSVDVSLFLPSNIATEKVEAVKKELNIKKDDICLCFVGRLGKEKSLDVAIDYFASSFKGEKRFRFFIIGTGPKKDELQQQINSLGIQEQVVMLGRIENEDLPPYYQAFHLFTTASLTEMNSISLLEATASGLYAINRLDHNNTDQITAGENGEVYTNYKEFEFHVRRFASISAEDKLALRQKVIAHAQKYGRSEFTHAILNVYVRAILDSTRKRIFRVL